MKKIGFIDYYISEWHANNYPIWFADVCKKTGQDFKVAYAWAEEYVSPKDGVNTDEWCERFGVERCATIEELCEKSDYILILAPSNPETHLRYAEVALKYGKNTYIDKTFAPDVATAKKIFALAEKYNTKFFSTSALRFSDELVPFEKKAKAISVTSGGIDIDEYIIHPVEMIIKTLGIGVEAVRLESYEGQYTIKLRYSDGKIANIFYSVYMPYSAAVCNEEGRTDYFPNMSNMFTNLMADILRFYNEGTTSFDVAETMEVMRVREAIINSKATPGEWVNV